MKIAICMTVRNEYDRIKDNILYHINKHGVDFIFIIDNGSNDGTYKLVKELNDPRVIIKRTEPNFGFHQGIILSKAFSELSQHYDWILPTDADEYWVTRNHGNLRKLLEGIDPKYEAIQCLTYNLRETELDPSEEKNFLRRLLYATPPSNSRFILRGSAAAKIENIEFGGHKVEVKNGFHLNTVEGNPDDIVKFHYNHIDFQDAVKRVINQAEGFIVGFGDEWLNGKTKLGMHIQRKYKLIKQGTFHDYYRDNFVWTKKQLEEKLKNRKAIYLPDMIKDL